MAPGTAGGVDVGAYLQGTPSAVARYIASHTPSTMAKKYLSTPGWTEQLQRVGNKFVELNSTLF